jgi:hypothetical protein
MKFNRYFSFVLPTLFALISSEAYADYSSIGRIDLIPALTLKYLNKTCDYRIRLIYKPVATNLTITGNVVIPLNHIAYQSDGNRFIMSSGAILTNYELAEMGRGNLLTPLTNINGGNLDLGNIGAQIQMSPTSDKGSRLMLVEGGFDGNDFRVKEDAAYLESNCSPVFSPSASPSP